MSGVDRNGDNYGVADITLDVASVTGFISVEQTFTVNGLDTDMVVMVNKPSHDASLVVGNARVSAANTLAITFGNCAAGSTDPASETYKLFWFKPNITTSGAIGK